MAPRPTNEMPSEVRDALLAAGVMDDYLARPHYQRNDYLGWIASAQRPATRAKRTEQMLEELRLGGVYMKMDHPPSRK